MHAFHENPDHINIELTFIIKPLRRISQNGLYPRHLLDYLKPPRKTVYIQIRLLLLEQPDPGPHCLPLYLHVFNQSLADIFGSVI